MGGRGTFAAGINVPYTYKTVDKIKGVKIIQPTDSSKSFSMPEEAHSSTAYILLDKTGVFRQLRKYNSGHEPIFEIGYHFESSLSKNGKPVLHVHEFSAPGIEHRKKSRPIRPDELKKYRKYFKGVKL